MKGQDEGIKIDRGVYSSSAEERRHPKRWGGQFGNQRRVELRSVGLVGLVLARWPGPCATILTSCAYGSFLFLTS